VDLPPSWERQLRTELAAPYFRDLSSFVDTQRRDHTVFPPDQDVFAAFEHAPYDAVKVLLLGQDPYHGAGQAHGLCFSVRRGVRPPPSLKNAFKELRDDLGIDAPEHGNLEAWADQGVLLLNTVLTVRESEAHSHKGQGWERFTDAVISTLSRRERPFVALLWGGPARKKKTLIDQSRHRVVEGPHPSPLSAHRGFFGSRPFSGVNAALEDLGEDPIDWRLPA
jgi:uracil-DNA glycosylase